MPAVTDTAWMPKTCGSANRTSDRKAGFTWHFGGHGKYSWLSTIIEDQVFPGQLVQWYTYLSVVTTAPDQDIAIHCTGDRMVVPSSNLFDPIWLETADHRGLLDQSFRFLGAATDPSLPKIVQAPGIHVALPVDRKAVEKATGDANNVLQAKPFRLEKVELVALGSTAIDPAAELALLRAAPCPQAPVVMKCQNMIPGRGEHLNVAQLRNSSRDPLDLHVPQRCLFRKADGSLGPLTALGELLWNLNGMLP